MPQHLDAPHALPLEAFMQGVSLHMHGLELLKLCSRAEAVACDFRDVTQRFGQLIDRMEQGGASRPARSAAYGGPGQEGEAGAPATGAGDTDHRAPSRRPRAAAA
jgi:hypothetical protein